MFKEIRFRGMVYLGVLVLSGIFASCGLLGGSKSELETTRWQLQSLAGSPPPESVVVTAEFNDGRISGSAGCNSYGAAYSAKDGKFSLDAVAMTEMACVDAGVMDTEQQFLGLLSKATGYRLNEDSLELLDDSGATLLTFGKTNP